MARSRQLVGLAVGILLTATSAAGGAAAATSTAAFEVVTLRHAPSGFSIRAPEGFKLSLRNGVYVLRKGRVSVSFSRSATSVTPLQFGTALLGQLGGRVVVRTGDARHLVAQVERGSRRDAFVVERIGSRLAVTTSAAANSLPVALETLRTMGLSARGGVALRAPKARAQASIPLGLYRAPGGGATALVPTEPGWDVQSDGQGAIQGSSTRGSFVFGFSINVPTPEFAPPNTPPNIIVAPYLNASAALVQFFPRLAPSLRNIRIRKILRDAVLPSFTSSGMILFDYQVNGKPWTGVATVGTDSPAKYGGSLWNFYYSAVGVPAGSNPAVGVGLLRAWKSWDPSGAIAARTRQAVALINETNEIWRQTSEFRSQTADRQSRDVGCLLQGYYIIEDNSRKYDLPPLPCGQIYTERG